jgi:putative heme-binding domain-containing protein
VIRILTLTTILTAIATAAEPEATPISAIKAAPGFQVELLFSVPQQQFGSWVNLCVDPKGRLIVSDQYGSLYRVTPPPIGSDQEIKIEKIDLEVGGAQGLLWAFDSLYVMVNHGGNPPGGVYRVRDTDGDDQLDKVEHLRQLDGRGEHGPHALLLAPDGKSLYVVCGDTTPLTEFRRSRVPTVWDEDNLLPRTYGRGFMKGTRAPGGYIARVEPDGTDWELVSVGFRNEYDAAFNADGELFTFDADMEWDLNTPWYRPTRVCHVVSGAEFGWRNGAGKWPAYYPDSLPAVVDIGPGSPTGICFGYGAGFPTKYQNALFVSDWSYGKLYAVHLQPRGASYTAVFEEFVSGTPLPLTDVVINPIDSAMYFAIGGRRVQSGLYRVTHTGASAVAASADRPSEAVAASAAAARAIRRELEALHVGDHASAVETAWPYLGHADRFLRFAARTAIEHRPLGEWRARALHEPDRQARLTALLALVRRFERADKGTEPDIDSPPPNWDSADVVESDQDRAAARREILAAVTELPWAELTKDQRITLLRVLSLTLLRLGPLEAAARQELIERFDRLLPAETPEVNSELVQLLVYLQAPNVAGRTIELLRRAPTQEEQIDYAKSLRHLRVGWTPELREAYFDWFNRARDYRGGASFSLFVQHIKEDAVALLDDSQEQALDSILNPPPADEDALRAKPRPVVKHWELAELQELVDHGLVGRNFDRGREMFGAANCFACHRFDNQGGAVGPDLTALSGRFSTRDLLESIVDPNKVISDQYAAVTIVTVDGKSVTGRIVNLNGKSYSIRTDMLDPDGQTKVERDQIDEMFPSKISMMPAGLLDTLNETEILDLMAYLLSRGDRKAGFFD